MALTQLIKKKINEPLTTFKLFERTIAAFCILIPFFLWLDEKVYGIGSECFICDPKETTTVDRFGFRESISDYVYMYHSFMFGMLLCIAAMLFIYNGAVYFNYRKHTKSGIISDRPISKHGIWYNVVLGLLLLGIILLPHCQYKFIHTFFAVSFFVGNVLVLAFFSKDKYQTISRVLALACVIAAAFEDSLLPKLFHFTGLSILGVEWISLTAIGVHFILEALD